MNSEQVQRLKNRTGSSSEDVALRGARGTSERLRVSARIAQQFRGHDLGHVRVHSGAAAAEANDRLHSHAYTIGEHVVLGRSSTSDLLSHELAHVVQQQAKPADDLGDVHERQADRVGRSMAPMPRVDGHGGLSPAHASVQMAPNQAGTTDPDYVVDWVRARETGSVTPADLMDRLSNGHSGNSNRYFYTATYGWVDVRHFGAAASLATSWGSTTAETLGGGNEVVQWFTEWGDSYRSGFSPEDIPSNAAGAEFGDDYINSRSGESVADALQRWMVARGGRPAAAHHAALPVTDPSVRGGATRGSSNASRTQSTASGEASQQLDSAERTAAQLLDPWTWIRGLGG